MEKIKGRSYLYKTVSDKDKEVEIAIFRKALHTAKKIGIANVERKSFTSKVLQLATEIHRDESLIFKYLSGKKNITNNSRNSIKEALHKEAGEIFAPVVEINDFIELLFNSITSIADMFDEFPPKIKKVICDNFDVFSNCPMHIWQFITVMGDNQKIDVQILKKVNIDDDNMSLRDKPKILDALTELKKEIEYELNCSSNIKGSVPKYFIYREIIKRIKSRFECGNDILEILGDLLQRPLIPLHILCCNIISNKNENWNLLLAYINLGVGESPSEQQKMVFVSK